MRKALVIIAVVAILGAISALNKNGKPATFKPGAAATQSQSSPSASSSGANATTPAATTYKDGTYDGTAVYMPYGTVQVAAVINGGKITDIRFLQMPGPEPESQQRTSFAEPYLKQSAISNQSANIDFVSGATDTSQSFEQSLQAALNQAATS